MSLWQADADVNIARGKPVSVNSYPEYGSQLNDGNDNSCFGSEELNINWIVLDLGKVTKIKKIALKGETGKEPISAYLTDDFLPCHFHRQYKDYKKCKIGFIQDKQRMEIECQPSENTGQYLVLIKGDFKSEKKAEKFYLCEIEVFGDASPNSNPKKRPEVKSDPLTPITANDFKIAKEIRSGVTSFLIPEYSQSFSYIGNCEPLVWVKTPEALHVFSVACQSSDGKSRLVAFAKSMKFSEILSDGKMVQLKNNLLKWLSPKVQVPNVVKKDEIKTLNDLKTKIKAGDILDFNVQQSYSKDVLDQIVSMVKGGNLAVNVDWTFFVDLPKDVSDAYKRIFDIFNVDFKYDFATWDAPKNIPLKDSDFNEDVLSIDNQIARLVKNHDYLIKNGKQITETFSKVPNELILRSSIKSQFLELIKKYDSYVNYICPCKAGQAVNPADRVFLDLYGQLTQSQVLVNSGYKLPCIDLFPGDFETIPAKKVVSLSVTGQTNSTDTPIGYYLEAGATLKYEVQASKGLWSMSVGCHTDHLGADRKEWSRYPDIYVERVPLKDKGEIFSPFGGVLWLYNEVVDQSIKITLSNVVSTPFFNLRSSSPAADWEKQRNNPGLWAQIAGDNVVFCEKSSKVKGFSGKYIENLMKNNWDKLVKSDYALKSVNWKDKRPERVVLDIMVSYGFGHAGYPIVVWDSWHEEIFNETLIFSEGSWGMCHEIGHNMQDELWTFEDVVEVTNNVFCLFNHDKLWRLPRFGTNEKILRDNEEDILKHLRGSATFSSWRANPWIGLGIYTQMANHFGWGFYKKFFGYYKDNVKTLSSNEEKIAMWISVASQVSKQNLKPLFDFWGVPVTDAVSKEISKFPCFFPDDFWSKMSPKRYNDIKQKYPNCNTVSTFNEDYSPKSEEIDGMRPNVIQEISSKPM